MMRVTTRALAAFPKEAEIIGRILLGFGELEYLISCCAGQAMPDKDMAVRALYRVRGADVRLQIAEAFMRPPYEAIGLKDGIEAAIGAARYSKSIRNQYAHANWLNGEEQGLFFIDLNKSASSNVGPVMHQAMHIDFALLNRQVDYLYYASDWFFYLWSEYEKRAGTRASHTAQAPKIIDKPPLHSPQEEHPFPRKGKVSEPPQGERAEEAK